MASDPTAAHWHVRAALRSLTNLLLTMSEAELAWIERRVHDVIETECVDNRTSDVMMFDSRDKR